MFSEQDMFFQGGIESMPTEGSEKAFHIIFLVDNSGSMSLEHRMDAVNGAFSKMLPELQNLQVKVQDAYKIYISVMAFNEDPEWITSEPTPILRYVHTPIQASEYVTFYSRAFDELNVKLSRSNFISQKGKIMSPYIMLLTDGAPTPGDDYERALDRLNENGWYHEAQRYAVLIGEDTIQDPDARNAVSKFVNNVTEGIITANDAREIVKSVSDSTIHVLAAMTQRKKAAPVAASDPFPMPTDPAGTAGSEDPFGGSAPNTDPFGDSALNSDPFGGTDPFGGSTPNSDPFSGSFPF